MSAGKIKLFVHTLLNQENKDFLRGQLPAGATVLFLDEIAESARRQEFAASRYVYGNPPAEWLEADDLRIRWMQLYSAGFSEYQHLEKPIRVSNMHGFFARPCAETVLAGILALYRKIDKLSLLKDRKEWVGGALRPGMQLLHGKKVVFIGAGTIALAIRELLDGFHCQVKLYGRTHPEAAVRSRDDLLKIIPESDILINTLPGTAETHEFISASVLEAMQPHAVFANIGRGSTVEQPALIRALRERLIGGAVLDVYEREPLPRESPLWDLENVILTQHTGGGFADEEREKVAFFLQNLERVLKDETPLNLVELHKGY